LVSNDGRKIAKQYAELVSFAKEYDYDKVLSYFLNTMLKRLPGKQYTPLARFIVFSQKF